MHLSQNDSILTTLSYAEIFHYPLTPDELHLWRVKSSGLNKTSLANLKDIIIISQGKERYIHLHAHNFVSERRMRERWAKEKWQRVQRIVNILRLVPTVLLIGVTGGLAMNNARKNDDIDLFFIVSDKTIWISRLMITVLVEVVGLRRKPGQKEVKNKICLNMYMSSSALSLPKKEQDLFAAHEVLQMHPVFDRGAYTQFLNANSWVKYFLPNAWEEKRQEISLRQGYGRQAGNKRQIQMEKSKTANMFRIACLMLLRFLEPLAKKTQLWYMKKRITTEVVSDSVLRFHPFDARAFVKKELGKRLARYNIPLDNVFYAS